MQLSDIKVGSVVWSVGANPLGPIEVRSIERATGRMVVFTGGPEDEPVDCLVTADEAADLRMAPESWAEVSIYDRLAVVILDGPSTVRSVLACIGEDESDNVVLDLWAASEAGCGRGLVPWLMDRAPGRVEIPAGCELDFGVMRVYVVQPYMSAFGQVHLSCVEYRIGRSHGWTALGTLGPPSEDEEAAMADRTAAINTALRERVADAMDAAANHRPKRKLKKRMPIEQSITAETL